MKNRLFLIVVAFFFFSLEIPGFAKKFDDKGFAFFQWENPAPRFHDLEFDMGNVDLLIGDSQLLIYHTPRNFALWANDDKGGSVREYTNQRFVSSLSVINKSRDEVISAYMDFRSYPKIMKQCTAARILKSSGNQHLVRICQEYNTPVINLNAEFRFLYDIEGNEDISMLLLEGDVDAGVARIEFIPIDENKTLVVNTTWGDLENARLMYRVVINAMPEVRRTAPLGTAAMLTEQYRRYIDDINVTIPQGKTEDLPVCPNIPVYNIEDIPVDTWRKLSAMGTLVFVQPVQWINTAQGAKSVEFVTAIALVPGNISDVQAISGDFSRFSEYVERAKHVEVRTVNGQHEIFWQFKFNLGFIGFDFEYVTLSEWQNNHTVFYLGTRGDIHPLHGAFEWIDLRNNSTLIAFTVANQISDEAPWVLRMGRKIPNINLLSSMFMSVLAVENQISWVMGQIAKPEKLLAEESKHNTGK